MFVEVVSDARQDIVPIGPEIAPAIRVGIDRISAIARRNELPGAHRAGIGTDGIEYDRTFLSVDQKKGLELGGEKVGARRIGKGQRGQGIDHAIGTHAFAIQGFDSENGQNHFGLDAESFRGCTDQRCVFDPELRAGVDAGCIQKYSAILIPGYALLACSSISSSSSLCSARIASSSAPSPPASPSAAIAWVAVPPSNNNYELRTGSRSRSQLHESNLSFALGTSPSHIVLEVSEIYAAALAYCLYSLYSSGYSP